MVIMMTNGDVYVGFPPITVGENLLYFDQKVDGKIVEKSLPIRLVQSIHLEEEMKDSIEQKCSVEQFPGAFEM